MYLLMMELLMSQQLKPHKGLDLTEHLQSSTQGNTDPIHLRLLDKTRLAHRLLDPPQPREQDREGGEDKAQSSPSILSVLRAAGAVPWKHEQSTKYLPEMVSVPMSTILGKNLSPLPPEQSCTLLKICFSAVFTFSFCFLAFQ